MKRVLMLLALIVMFISAGCSETEGVTWNIDSNGTLTISGKGKMDEYQNTDEVPWHQHRLTIKEVVVEDGVKNICNYAFTGCADLKSVSIPNSVTTIGAMSFFGCEKLESIDIPESVKVISDSALSFCESLTEVRLPANLTRITKYTFSGCRNLQCVFIGERVNYIERNTFIGCDSLKEIYFSGTQKQWNKIEWEEVPVEGAMDFLKCIDIHCKDTN